MPLTSTRPTVILQSNLWQRLDTLGDDIGAAERAVKLKQDLEDLRVREDERFNQMLKEVAPDIEESKND